MAEATDTAVESDFMYFIYGESLNSTHDKLNSSYVQDTSDEDENEAERLYYRPRTNQNIDGIFCKDHGKKIDYFCKNHSCTLCQDCAIMIHMQCTNIVKCAEVLDAYLDGKPTHEDLIESNQEAVSVMESDIQSCEDQLSEDRNIVKAEIRSLKKAIVNKLELTEKELFSEIDAKCDIHLEQYRKCREHCNSIQEQLSESSRILGTLTEESNPEYAVTSLIEMKKARESELSSIQNMREKSLRHRLSFTEDAGIDNFLRKCSQFGHVNESSTFLTHENLQRSYSADGHDMPTSAQQPYFQLQKTLNSKIPGERHNWITSVSFMHDDRILIIDKENEKVKLYTEDCRFLDFVHFENTRLFAVVAVNDDEIAVTMPVKMKISFISTSGNRLKEKHTIDTKQPCFGIARCYKQLFVCCGTVRKAPCCIKIFDSEHNFVRNLTFDNEGKAMFSSLSEAFIAVSPDHNQVSVVDKRSDRHTIVTFDLNGKVKSRDFMPSWRDTLHGLAYSKTLLFMALYNRATLSTFSENKDLIEIQTSKSIKWPYAIAFNSTKSRIAVSQVHPMRSKKENNIIHFFSLHGKEDY